MQSKNKIPTTAYERARKRVDDIKGFYVHLAVYCIVGFLVFFTNGRFIPFVGRNSSLQDIDFLNWIDWNTYGTPIIWGLFLVFHGLNVYGMNPFLGKAWERRQIEKFMNESKEY